MTEKIHTESKTAKSTVLEWSTLFLFGGVTTCIQMFMYLVIDTYCIVPRISDHIFAILNLQSAYLFACVSGQQKDCALPSSHPKCFC